jgi:hypothetical protein
VFFSCKISDSKLLRLAQERGICPTVKDSSSSTTKEVITRHDTDIDVKEKTGPDFSFEFGDDCDSIKAALDELKRNPIIKVVNGIKTTVKSDGKKIQVSCNEEAYRLRLNNAITQRDLYREQFELLVRKEKCLLEHCNSWCNFTNWWFWITAGLMAFYIFFKLRRGLRSIRWP